jgi:hypothetical protein
VAETGIGELDGFTSSIIAEYLQSSSIVVDDELHFLEGRGQEEKQRECRGEHERDCTRFREIPKSRSSRRGGATRLSFNWSFSRDR